MYSEGEARAEPMEIKKMKAYDKNRIAMQVANNAYNGHGSSVKQIAAYLDFNIDAVNEVVLDMVNSGTVELKPVMIVHPINGSQRTEVYCLPVIDGKGRSSADAHIFSRDLFIKAVSRCELVR